MRLRETNIFQQDGAPPHRSKLVKQWIANQKFKILEEWPAISPDLNVVENCWIYLKKKVAEHRPGSLTELKERIIQVWISEISKEFCHSLIDSMPRRIEVVIKAKVKSTKY